MGGFREIGIVGLTNMSILLSIVVWKTISLFMSSGAHAILTDSYWRKRIVLQLLLIASISCDLPMYIAFVATGDYTLVSYSFHKFNSALLFAAYSMTIYDWSAVLYDIKEIDHRPLFFRRNSLIAITVLMFGTSAVNFVYMYTTSGVDSYINSPFYVVNIFLQVVSALFLTGMMLSAGVRLSVRIRGVCGELQEGMTTMDTSSVRGLQSAVNRLNSVMFVCFSCILVQVLLLMLNYALGYSNETGKTVGPIYFYWTFYFWVPIWGPVLSLMYLGRSSFQKRDVLLDVDTLSPLAHGDTSYGGSGRMTASMRKTLSNSMGTTGAGHTGNNSVISGEERSTVYRPPDYPSALFSRDSAYQYDEEGVDGSGTNGSFDAPLNMLPMGGGADSSTLVDYYDAFLLNSPPIQQPKYSVDTSASGDTSSYPSRPSIATDTTLG